MYTLDYDISKEDILKHVTETDIMSHYLSIENLRRPLLSPFREEKTPSFTIKQSGDKVIWRDWGSGEHGDAFTFVQKWYRCSFYDALKHINDDLILDIGGEKSPVKTSLMAHERASIITQRQMMTMSDYNYWSKYRIKLSTLASFDVYSVRYCWINGQLRYTYRNSCPVYEYFIDKDVIQIYSPLAKKKDKFRTNGDKKTLLGGHMLPLFGEKLILSKSMKDIMVLFEGGLAATSFIGESTLDDSIMNMLLKRFNNIIILYDNDKAGRESSDKIQSKYGIQRFFTAKKNISDEMEANPTSAIEYMKWLKSL